MMNVPLISRFSQFECRETKFASEIMSNVLSPLKYAPLRPNGDFHQFIQMAQIDDVCVWHSTSSTGFAVSKQASRSRSFELHFIEAGHCSSLTHIPTIEAYAGDVLLLKDFSNHEFVCQPYTSQLCIRIPFARLSMVMGTEFGDPLGDLSGMLDVADVRSADIQCLKQIAGIALSLVRNAPVQDKSSTAILFLCTSLLTLFAESWPRSSGQSSSSSARPFYIKKAVEWMQSHAMEKITLAQLSLIAGVSGRTLQLGFQRFCGLTPMGFLQKVRLENAYKELLSEPEKITIDEIARRWGFSNPGKFAAEIRAIYGENPLHIRRRAKTM